MSVTTPSSELALNGSRPPIDARPVWFWQETPRVVDCQAVEHAARSIAAQLSGGGAAPFHYRDLGTMATVGRNDAVAQLGPLRLSGFVGWLAWLLVHIVRTVGLQTRASVLLSWISGYVFADRPVRLITGPRRDGPAAPALPVPGGARPLAGAEPTARLPAVGTGELKNHT